MDFPFGRSGLGRLFRVYEIPKLQVECSLLISDLSIFYFEKNIFEGSEGMVTDRWEWRDQNRTSQWAKPFFNFFICPVPPVLLVLCICVSDYVFPELVCILKTKKGRLEIPAFHNDCAFYCRIIRAMIGVRSRNSKSVDESLVYLECR